VFYGTWSLNVKIPLLKHLQRIDIMVLKYILIKTLNFRKKLNKEIFIEFHIYVLERKKLCHFSLSNRKQNNQWLEAVNPTFPEF
jgi:hypothetical protein